MRGQNPSENENSAGIADKKKLTSVNVRIQFELAAHSIQSLASGTNSAAQASLKSS